MEETRWLSSTFEGEMIIVSSGIHFQPRVHRTCSISYLATMFFDTLWETILQTFPSRIAKRLQKPFNERLRERMILRQGFVRFGVPYEICYITPSLHLCSTIRKDVARDGVVLICVS